MTKRKMPATLRLSKEEQEELRKKANEINRLRVNNGLEPLKDSEIVHKILSISITYVKSKASGEIFLDIP